MTLKIKLRKEERNFLEKFVRSGTKKARAIARANVLLLADEGYSTKSISKITRVHRRSVWRIKKRYLEEGLESALEEKPRPGQPRKYTEKHEAEIIAMACASPPEGRKRWTIRLLMQKARKRPGFETINRESIRLILKKARLSLG
jgi:transposase